jgi:hypothetical protein
MVQSSKNCHLINGSEPHCYEERMETLHGEIAEIFLSGLRSGKGARGSVVVKALCYKPEGRGFDTRRGKFLNLPNPSGRTRPWGLLSL